MDKFDILAGIKVLDFSRFLAGPMCSMMMGEFGAEVVAVENTQGGDEVRQWPPFGDAERKFSGYYASANRSKRSIALDLKSPEGLAIALELASNADVVMEGFTPGVAQRLGLGYDKIRAINDRVIYYSLSGFGQTGPYRTKGGFDPVLQAMSGLMSLTGEKNRGPVKSMVPVADLSAAIHGFAAILGALFYRERTGRGQAIDLGMLDVMVSMLSVVGTRYLMTGEIPERCGTENPQRVPSAAFECADGTYIQVAPNQRQWAAFCELMARSDWKTDKRFATAVERVNHANEVNAEVGEAMKTKVASEWLVLFEQHGIVAGPINDLKAVFNDPQVIDRKMVKAYDVVGIGEVPAIDLPFRFSESSAHIRRPPPFLGEHTVEIMLELGRSEPQIYQLMSDGVIRGFRKAAADGD